MDSLWVKPTQEGRGGQNQHLGTSFVLLLQEASPDLHLDTQLMNQNAPFIIEAS